MAPERVPKSLIDEFCTITGGDSVIANNLLEACANNLEMAVNMHMEGLSSSDADPSTSMQNCGENDVRAPIPQKREVLVDGPDDFAYAFRGRKRTARSVFDKFRDFEAEAKHQEDELLRSNSESCPSGSSEGGGKDNYSRSRFYKKKKTLEDLFRPPVDLMYKGTFQSARDTGISMKKWLLVNVQDSTEFPCQVLNRDVWSNASVRSIVKEHFIFWQIYQDSEEGQRYMNFYKINEWPYVAVIDPRTGECLATWHKLDALTFCDLITEYLSNHPNFNKDHFCQDSKDEETQSNPNKKARMEIDSNILESDEAAQIEAAIQASLQDGEGVASASTGSKKIKKNNENDIDHPSVIVKEKDEEDLNLNSCDELETFESDSDVCIDEHSSRNDGVNLEDDFSVGNVKTKSGDSAAVVSKEHNHLNNIEDKGTTSSAVQQITTPLDTNEEMKEWKKYLGWKSDPESEIMLRLPDGSRNFITMPSSSKLKALVLYVASKGFSNESYELVTNFPRQKLSYLDFEITLKTAGLFPKETVFVQSR